MNSNNDFNIDKINLDSVSNLPNNSYDYINNLAINPIVLVILIIVIIVYFLLFGSLNNKGNSGDGYSSTTNNNGGNFFEAILWGLFILLILLNGISYFFNANIFATIKNFFTATPELNISLKDSNLMSNGGLVNPNAPESEQIYENILEKEVYHISDNKYNYDQAKAVCKAFDGELANYEQLEDAYEKGANWCSYGWSADQLALFPTNLKLWKKLQKSDGNKNACGRPGINGGYIANPNAKFGVNCYGNKPLITPLEKDIMENSSYGPKSEKEIKFNELVDYYKNNLRDIIIAPFSKKNWNEGLI